MVSVRSTRNFLAANYFDLFPDGSWWVSLYGYPSRLEKKWEWKKLRRTPRLIVDYTERIELTPRFRTPITLRENEITPVKSRFEYQNLLPGIYDQIAVHAAETGPMIDYAPIPVTHAVGGDKIVANLTGCTIT